MKKTLWSSLVAGLVLSANAFAADKAMALFPQTNWGDNTVSISLRYLGGATVNFTGLGTTQSVNGTDIGPVLGGAVNRYYDDGRVLIDPTGNADGTSRLWSFTFPSQDNKDGTLSFHSYRSESSGFSIEKEAGGSMGWEVSLGRRMGNFSRRTMWGITGGFGFTDFRTEFAGKVPASLITTTDVYSLNGRAAPTPPYTAPSSTTSGGSVIDTTVPLGSAPIGRTVTTRTVEDLVSGAWKIKGAYFTMRFGPSIRTILSRRWSVQASVGASLTYADSRYTIDSALQQITKETTVGSTTTKEVITAFNSSSTLVADKSKEVVTLGVYADLNVEYWLTPRTGLYGGVAMIQRGSFEQSAGGFAGTSQVSGSKAEVDLGNGAGLQLGFIHRF